MGKIEKGEKSAEDVGISESLEAVGSAMEKESEDVALNEFWMQFEKGYQSEEIEDNEIPKYPDISEIFCPSPANETVKMEVPKKDQLCVSDSEKCMEGSKEFEGSKQVELQNDVQSLKNLKSPECPTNDFPLQTVNTDCSNNLDKPFAPKGPSEQNDEPEDTSKEEQEENEMNAFGKIGKEEIGG